jgi:hypothetical protein
MLVNRFYEKMSNKKASIACLFILWVSTVSLVRETFAAIDRSFVAGLERQFSLAAAFRASCDERLTISHRAFLRVAAGLATLRFVYETFFVVKFLLARCEHEIRATVFAL